MHATSRNKARAARNQTRPAAGKECLRLFSLHSHSRSLFHSSQSFPKVLVHVYTHACTRTHTYIQTNIYTSTHVYHQQVSYFLHSLQSIFLSHNSLFVPQQPVALSLLTEGITLLFSQQLSTTNAPPCQTHRRMECEMEHVAVAADRVVVVVVVVVYSS